MREAGEPTVGDSREELLGSGEVGEASDVEERVDHLAIGPAVMETSPGLFFDLANGEIAPEQGAA